MTTSLPVSRRCDPVPGWHPAFLAHVLPAVETVARVRFRNLPLPEREEATAEAVAGAMIAFLRLSQRGKNPIEFAGRLATFAVARVASGRLSCSADNSADVMSRLARRQRGFTVESFESAAQRTKGGWEVILAEDGRCTPAEIAASRIDFADWLNGMRGRRRQVAEALAAGYRTEEAAAHFKLSAGRISQMRREFENSWRAFQSERPRPILDRCPAAA